MPKVLATLASDRLDLIDGLLSNRELDPFVRWSAADALKFLVRDGNLTRAEAVELLHRELRIALADPQEYVLDFLVLNLCDLGPQTAQTEIREAFDRQLVEEFLIDRDFVEKAIANGDVWEQELRRLPPSHLDDAVEHLRSFHYFKPRPPVRQEPRTANPRPPRSAQYDRIAESNLENASAVQSGTIRSEGPRIGRNDPCPCGSGKKYKKCCLRNDQAPEIGSLF